MKSMVKILATIVTAFFAMIVLTGCDEFGDGTTPVAPASPRTSSSVTEESGIGITMDGKIGIDLGNGLVMPMDGSGMSFDTGF